MSSALTASGRIDARASDGLALTPLASRSSAKPNPDGYEQRAVRLSLSPTILFNMDIDYVALSIFSSYFLIIIWLFQLILRDIAKQVSANKLGPVVYIFGALTVFSFIHTWYFMLGFMRWSFVNYEVLHPASFDRVLLERISDWLSNSGLFEQAWFAACEKPVPWWWSEQICLFTVGSWTVIVATEGTRHNIKRLWAYMLLGQLVAIAVASNLFYLALSLSTLPKNTESARKSSSWAGPSLWISVLASLITVALSPFTTTRTFLPNLLVMHAAIIIPLLPNASPYSTTEQKYSVRLRTLYSFVLVLALATRTRTILAAAATVPSQSPLGLFSAAWEVLKSHPAQSSISWDVIWTTGSFILWIAMKRLSTSEALSDIPYLMLTSPLVSVGLTAPYILREELTEVDEGVKQE